MNEINRQMERLTVAAHATITDYADTRVRGHLREHPDLVAHRLDELTNMIQTVRETVERERATGQWEALDTAPAAQLDNETAEYGNHVCDCPHCLRAAGGEDPAPVVFTAHP